MFRDHFLLVQELWNSRSWLLDQVTWTFKKILAWNPWHLYQWSTVQSSAHGMGPPTTLTNFFISRMKSASEVKNWCFSFELVALQNDDRRGQFSALIVENFGTEFLCTVPLIVYPQNMLFRFLIFPCYFSFPQLYFMNPPMLYASEVYIHLPNFDCSKHCNETLHQWSIILKGNISLYPRHQRISYCACARLKKHAFCRKRSKLSSTALLKRLFLLLILWWIYTAWALPLWSRVGLLSLRYAQDRFPSMAWLYCDVGLIPHRKHWNSCLVLSRADVGVI